MRRFFSSVLFFLSGAAIGIWGWSMWRQSAVQKQDEAAFNREVAAPASPRTPPVAPAPAKFTAREARRGAGVVARLSIPRIQLRAMVREGDDDDTLDVALGHIPGTALPGQKGNVGVAGHRDRLFRRLAELARDDRIELQTPVATYTYKVDQMAIVSPQAVSVLAPGHGSELTLVTCYPFNYIGSAPKRYIVTAHLISQGAGDGAVPALPSGTHE
jgi:LPXTG-site transpeptidase (sortase) family protein